MEHVAPMELEDGDYSHYHKYATPTELKSTPRGLSRFFFSDAISDTLHQFDLFRVWIRGS